MQVEKGYFEEQVGYGKNMKGYQLEGISAAAMRRGISSGGAGL